MKQREIGLDLIRTLAIVCVVCGHFFSVNTPYNEVSKEGVLMLVQGCLKSVFCSLGVPLFLMLTGYFNCKKKFSVQYYKNIKRILTPYIVISVITWAVLSSCHSIKELILGTLGYKIIGYAWYVEMFIGFYLIVPFLNMVVEKVFTSGNKQLLFGLFAILIFMTSLPPLIDRGAYRLVPNYWQACFPVLLYFTGAYIRYFKPVIRRKSIAILIISFIYLQYPVANWLKVHIIGGGEIASVFGPYYAVPGYVAMTLFFILLYKVNIKNVMMGNAITQISIASYEMFLFSYVCDRLIYPRAMERYYTTQSDFTVMFIPITLTVFILSYALAFTYNRIIALFEKESK